MKIINNTFNLIYAKRHGHFRYERLGTKSLIILFLDNNISKHKLIQRVNLE